MSNIGNKETTKFSVTWTNYHLNIVLIREPEWLEGLQQQQRRQ